MYPKGKGTWYKTNNMTFQYTKGMWKRMWKRMWRRMWKRMWKRTYAKGNGKATREKATS